MITFQFWCFTSSSLTFDIAQASLALFSLNRDLQFSIFNFQLLYAAAKVGKKIESSKWFNTYNVKNPRKPLRNKCQRGQVPMSWLPFTDNSDWALSPCHLRPFGPLRSDARCGAQCSENRRSDRCNQLHDKLCGFFLAHCSLFLIS